MSEFAQVQPDGETAACPVNSWNEWDPLEEVIVAWRARATIPSTQFPLTYRGPRGLGRLCPLVGGRRYPRILTSAAQRELDEFIHVLDAEGVIVRRPAITDFSRPFATLDWRSKGF